MKPGDDIQFKNAANGESSRVVHLVLPALEGNASVVYIRTSSNCFKSYHLESVDKMVVIPKKLEKGKRYRGELSGRIFSVEDANDDLVVGFLEDDGLSHLIGQRWWIRQAAAHNWSEVK